MGAWKIESCITGGTGAIVRLYIFLSIDLHFRTIGLGVQGTRGSLGSQSEYSWMWIELVSYANTVWQWISGRSDSRLVRGLKRGARVRIPHRLLVISVFCQFHRARTYSLLHNRIPVGETVASPLHPLYVRTCQQYPN